MSRRAELAGLVDLIKPATLIDVASAEVFRDEAVAYVSQIWAHGGVAELHVWPGGFDGYELMAPHSQLAQLSRQVRNDWVARLFRA
jgi:acetyl esterase/lipase